MRAGLVALAVAADAATVLHFHRPVVAGGHGSLARRGQGAPLHQHVHHPSELSRDAHWQVHFAGPRPPRCPELEAALNASHCSPAAVTGGRGAGHAHVLYTRLGRLLELPPEWGLRWANELRASRKVHPRLRAPTSSAARLLVTHSAPRCCPDPWVSALRQRGVSVRQHHSQSDRVRIDLETPGQAHRAAQLLAGIPEVRWVQPQLPHRTLNTVATWTVQTDERDRREVREPATAPFGVQGLDGSGEVVHVGDTGVDFDSCFFHDPAQKVTFYPQLNPLHRKVLSYVECVSDDGVRYHEDRAGAHGTHVSGSAVGAALSGPARRYNGLAYGAKLFVSDMACDASDLWLPNDLSDYYRPGFESGARIGHNSWGSDRSPTTYMATDRETDHFAYLNQQYLIVFAAGNVPDAGILSPGSAKNVLTVGAHMSSVSAERREDLAAFSAVGPTWDGRLKPEILAPGQPVTSAMSDGRLGSYQCSTTTKNGTSMAAPFVSAAAAIIRQYFREGWYPAGRRSPISAHRRFEPSAALIKSLIVHSARPIHGFQRNGSVGAAPNHIQGFGRLALQDVLHTGEGLSDVHIVNNMTSITHDMFNVCFRTEKGGHVRATLVWMDPPTAEGVSRALVNDLDLTVQGPGPKLHHANGLRTFDKNANTEQVDIRGAAAGSYCAAVHGHSVVEHRPFALGLPFALVVSAPGLRHVQNCDGAALECLADSNGEECSGHGSCDQDGICVCTNGWANAACSECRGDVHCSGHGTCDSAAQCTCFEGWAGDACSECAAGLVGPRCDVDCRRCLHGDCTAAAGCRCERNWGGKECSRCADGWRGDTCSVRSHWCADKRIVEINATAEPTGWLQINGERKYRNSLKCQWRIRAPGRTIRLTFHNFAVEDSFDWVGVHDGYTRQWRRVARRTGRFAEWTVDCSSGASYVVFESDLYDEGGQEGFDMHWQLL